MDDIDKIYFEKMFKNYSDVVTPIDLRKMLGIGRNKAYKLLQNGEIFSKRIGNNYFIPKFSIIEYLLKK